MCLLIKLSGYANFAVISGQLGHFASGERVKVIKKKEVDSPCVCVCVGRGGVNRSCSTHSKGEKQPRGGAETTAPSGAWAANEKNGELWEPGRRGTS